MTLSVVVDRESLSLADLTLPGDAGAPGLFVETVGRPGKTWRRTYASPGRLHGSVQTDATLEHSSIPLAIVARAASAAALDVLRDEAEEAFGQFVFNLTITEDGVTRVYECDCADVKWNDYHHGRAAALVSQASLTIPVYPLAVS